MSNERRTQNELSRVPQFRVIVNSRCGRSCYYCRPSGEAIKTAPNLQIEPKALMTVMRACGFFGIRSVKLTGGEPALWEPLVETAHKLKTDAGMEEVQIISRHPRIGELAKPLHDAGIDLINFSIDTLKENLHAEITGLNDLSSILGAVRQCADTGMRVKVNIVVMKGINESEIEALIEHLSELGVSEIKLLDVIKDLDKGSESNRTRLYQLRHCCLSDLYVSLDKITARLRSRAVSEETIFQGGLGHPLISMRLSSGLKIIVKDHTTGAWHSKACEDCRHNPCHDALMALRLTTDLRLQTCLLREDNSINLGPYITGGVDAIIPFLKEALSVYEMAYFSGGQNQDIPQLRDILPISLTGEKR